MVAQNWPALITLLVSSHYLDFPRTFLQKHHAVSPTKAYNIFCFKGEFQQNYGLLSFFNNRPQSHTQHLYQKNLFQNCGYTKKKNRNERCPRPRWYDISGIWDTPGLTSADLRQRWCCTSAGGNHARAVRYIKHQQCLSSVWDTAGCSSYIYFLKNCRCSKHGDVSGVRNTTDAVSEVSQTAVILKTQALYCFFFKSSFLKGQY